jgi:hypothetical protein
MPEMSICRGCDHVVFPDEDDYVVIDGILMHAACYETELDEKEGEAKAAQAKVA